LGSSLIFWDPWLWVKTQNPFFEFLEIVDQEYVYIYAILPLGSFLEKQGVCHTVALPFTLKSILRQKKNYGNSKISPCKKYNLQKIL